MLSQHAVALCNTRCCNTNIVVLVDFCRIHFRRFFDDEINLFPNLNTKSLEDDQAAKFFARDRREGFDILKV